MFGSRKLAKRSIVGTKVCAQRQDGRYYQGTIHSIQPQSGNVEFYSIIFSDRKSHLYSEKNIIGPGFQNITVAKLVKGQLIYTTINGREVVGRVCEHDDKLTNIVTIAVTNGTQEIIMERQLEDLRLMESRKSARLQDSCDTDYSKLADGTAIIDTKSQKKSSSHVIDVPDTISKQSRRRKASPDPEDMSDCDDMDAHAAAMVLTSLSCSPMTSHFQDYSTPPLGSSSIGSSGIGMGSDKSSPRPSISSTPSPPSRGLPNQISSSVPGSFVFSSTCDEGIGLDPADEFQDFYEDSRPKRKRKLLRTVYKCTWRTCGKICNSIPLIERHIRESHLKPKEITDDGSEISDHEEEFYYTDIDLSVDTVTRTFADMKTSSPPEGDLNVWPCDNTSNVDMEEGPLVIDDQPDVVTSHLSTGHSSSRDPVVTQAEAQALDHDYQKKDLLYSAHMASQKPMNTYSSSLPIQIPQNLSSSLSWQAHENQYGQPQVASPTKYGRHFHPSSYSPRGHAMHPGSSSPGYFSASPKSSPIHYKKTRSDTKKCRKVYGMDNRELWCTQCKWKKACTRYTD